MEFSGQLTLRSSSRASLTCLMFMFAGDGFEGPDVPAGYRDRPLPGGRGQRKADGGSQHEGGLLRHLHQSLVLRLIT